MKVLIIDTSRDRRHETMEVLRDKGFEAFGADGVVTGVMQIDHHGPDVVVVGTDIISVSSRRDLQQLSRGPFFSELPLVAAQVDKVADLPELPDGTDVVSLPLRSSGVDVIAAFERILEPAG
jgi:hypothetical protein